MPTPNSLDRDAVDVRHVEDDYFALPIVRQLSSMYAQLGSLPHATTYLLTHAIATAYANPEKP